MNCLLYLVLCRVQCCCCWKLVQSSKFLRGIYSWLINNSFSDRILPTSGHYICGNSKQKKTTASLLTFTIMKLECCKYGTHVHVKAVLAFRRSFNLSISADFIGYARADPEYEPRILYMYAFHCHKLVPTLSFAWISTSDTRIWCLLSQIFFPPEPTWNLGYIRCRLNCDGFSWFLNQYGSDRTQTKLRSLDFPAITRISFGF